MSIGSVDRTKPYCTVTIARSMVGVEPGTGIPGLDTLSPAFEAAGFQMTGFHSHEPDEEKPPPAYEGAHAKLREIAEAARSAAEELENSLPWTDAMGDPNEYDEEMRDIIYHAHSTIETAARELERITDEL